MVENKSFRAAGQHILLSDLYLGEYVNGDENTTSYLKLKDERQIVRVNVVGTVVMQKNLGAITVLKIDDGSDVMSLRFFDSHKGLELVDIGSVVLVIGRIREYNAERYIAAEIIKKVEPRWLRQRSLMLQSTTLNRRMEEVEMREDKKNVEVNAEVVVTEKVGLVTAIDSEPMKVVDEENPYLELMSLIASLDTGSGVALEVVVNESQFENTKELLKRMMESGDIFQNVPGKVKVL